MRSAIPTLRLLPFLAAALVAGACSDEPSTGPDGGSGGGAARTGSTYVMHRFDTDTTGVPFPGSGDTVVTTLAATGAQHAGQSGVSVFMQDSVAVARLRYESNGDVLYYPNWGGAAFVGWITLPVQSKGRTERTIKDTTYDYGGFVGRNRVTLGVEYVSSQQVTVGTTSVTAHEIRISLVDVSPLSADMNLTITSTHSVWYAPTLGYFTRIETFEKREDPYTSVVGPVAVSALTSYELK